MQGRVRSALLITARLSWLAAAAVALMAAISLIGGVELRSWRLASRPVVAMLFRGHDGLLFLQSLLMIPFVAVLSRRVKPSDEILAGIALLGILIVAIAEPTPGTFYVLPQALLGVWVLRVGRRLRGQLSRAVWPLSLITGVGLLLIGASLLVVLAYFGPSMLASPIRTQDPTGQAINRASHYVLRVGTYLGRLGLPLWMLVVAQQGRKRLGVDSI